MTKIEYLETLTKFAKDYRIKAMSSIERNAHMNCHTGAEISQDNIDALLVDFINFIGVRNGIDYALYTSDLSKPNE